jgi:hypothetical protein
VPELLREERISVVDQEALADQEAIYVIGEVARHLLHPGAMRLSHDAADLQPSGLEVYDEEHEGPREARECQYLHGEEVDRVDDAEVCLEERLEQRRRRLGAAARARMW